MGEITRNQLNNELILKRRKKKAIKRAIFGILFLMAILITFFLKAPIFNINAIEVEGNKIISKEDIVERSKLQRGGNIFYINIKKYKNNIMTNPYILSVNIKRKFPDTIIFQVNERNAFFYGNVGDEYYIIDEETRLLEKRKDMDGLNLIKIEGLQFEGKSLGSTLYSEKDREKGMISEFAKIITRNISGVNITSIDLSDFLNIKVYHNNICIILGTGNDLQDKLNKAINIILSKPELSKSKGYIDVSFKGNPVVFIEQ